MAGDGIVHLMACLVLGKMVQHWAVGCLGDYLIGAGIDDVEPCADGGYLMGPWPKRLLEHSGKS